MAASSPSSQAHRNDGSKKEEEKIAAWKKRKANLQESSTSDKAWQKALKKAKSDHAKATNGGQEWTSDHEAKAKAKAKAKTVTEAEIHTHTLLRVESDLANHKQKLELETTLVQEGESGDEYEVGTPAYC